MDSYQPFSPSFKSSLMATDDKPTPETAPDGFVGFLQVFIHEARDIHNICIYNKQDVYAKLYLTTDPESAASTQIINGGGKNPVFNQSLRFDVRTVEDSSLKCEVWMLSRVRNYLEDQLLGLALVPLSDVVVADGKLEGEFSLSSTDLFHSPAGFVKLSIAYSGSSPEVMAVVAPPLKPSAVPAGTDEPAGREYDKVEFPDLNVVDENKMMVSEYFGIQCANSDTQNAEGLIAPEEDCPDNEEAGVRVVESFATVTSSDTVEDLKKDTPVSSTSETGSSLQKDKSKEEETDSSSVATTDNAFPAPIININIEPENSVVQQDIVDMYMKSMQQFTDSLANMKLPMDIENNNNGSSSNTLATSSSSSNVSTANGDSGADQQPQKTGSRVFYGSRAFF